MVQILNANESKKTEKIFHISDIHIRLYRRKEEYLYCFKKLYETIREYKKGNHIIIITGDILHHKLEMSPECETMTFDFLETLSSIYPTFFILGNHDTLLNNRDRLDSLSSILYKRNIENLFYLKDTDIYQFNNLLFYVDSLIDDKKIDMVHISNNKINIGLFHGSIQGWKNCKGFISENGEKYIEDFIGMDYVLLGDIHLFQYMSKEKPVMAYPGSLISQNFGETDPDHGILVWDLIEKTQIFIRIENPYRYQDIFILSRERMKTDQKIYDIENIPIAPKGNIRIYGMENELESKLILNRLQKKWKDCIFSFQNFTPNVQKEDKIYLKDSDEEIIESFLKDNIKEDLYEEIENEIMKLWRERNQYYSSMQWNILRIEFSNLFGYGKDNIISFPVKEENNIIGIFGSNSVGKSTIIDIISLLLFDKLTRFSHGQTIPKEVIHFEEKEADGYLLLQIGGDLFRIEKKYKRQSSGKIKQQTNFYRIHEGISIELTEEQRNKTNQIIKDFIGSPDIFIYIHSFLQQREQSFRELTSSNKKKFLNELNGFSWFEKIEKEKKEILKELETKEKFLQSLLFYPIDDGGKKKELETLQDRFEQLKDTDNILEKKINSSYESLNNLKDDTLLEKKEKELESEINTLRKTKEENDFFLEKWESKIEFFERYSKNEIFIQWYGKEREEWEIFKRKRDSLSEENIKKNLEELYEKYSTEEIQIDDFILNLFQRNEIKKIKKEYESLKSICFEVSLKKKYNELIHPFEIIGNQDFYENMEKDIFQKWKEKEKKYISMVLYFSNLEKYKEMIKEENIPEFIEKGSLYQEDSFYQSYSFFFQKNENKFLELLKKEKNLNCNEIRNLIDSYEEELNTIKIPYLKKNKCMKTSEYEKYKEDIKIKPFQCKDCSFQITHEILIPLKELEDIETDKYVLISEIKVLENNMKECNFIPNPNCEICIQNPNYIIKKRSEKHWSEKKKELKEKEIREKEILFFLKKKMEGTRDIHFQEIEYSLDFFYKKKEEKEECRKRSEKEREIFLQKKQKIEDYEIQKKKIELEKKKKILEEKINLHKKDLDFLLSLYEKRNIIEFLKKEWKRKTILPSTFTQFIKDFNKFQDNITEEKLREIEFEKEDYKKKWFDFESNWKKDVNIKIEIQELEDRYLKKKQYEEWILEVEKYDKKISMEVIKKKIESFREEEKRCSEWKQHKEIYDFIDFLYHETTDSMSNLKEKRNKIKKSFIEEKLSSLEREFEIIKKDRGEYKTLKEFNRITEENIGRFKKEKEKIREKKEDLEEKIIKLRLDINSLQEKKIENETRIKEILSLQKEIEKEKIILKTIEKDGLPLYLLMKKMEPMERQINELISPFLPNKKVRFYIDQKTIEFGTFFTNEKHLCNYFGGMESFIIDLSLKLTFAKYGNLPRSNFFIIDEGISVLDNERIYNISFLFDFLSNITSNVLLISHIPQIRDFVDKEMVIEKKNEKSFIEYH